MDRNIELITAEFRDPTTGELITVEGETQEIVDKKIEEYFAGPDE